MLGVRSCFLLERRESRDESGNGNGDGDEESIESRRRRQRWLREGDGESDDRRRRELESRDELRDVCLTFRFCFGRSLLVSMSRLLRERMVLKNESVSNASFSHNGSFAALLEVLKGDGDFCDGFL